MKELQIILLSIFFLSCEESINNNKSNPKPISDSLEIKHKRLKKLVSRETDTIYYSDYVNVTCSNYDNSCYAELKFEPYISFNDFKVNEIYHGIKSPIDYNSNKTVKRYRTVLTEGYQQNNINFAGHYLFVSWGCGSPCQECALIDVISGKVYDGPPATYGYDFRKDSRMLIINPPSKDNTYTDIEWQHPAIFIWNEETKKFKERKSGLY